MPTMPLPILLSNSESSTVLYSLHTILGISINPGLLLEFIPHLLNSASQKTPVLMSQKNNNSAINKFICGIYYRATKIPGSYDCFLKFRHRNTSISFPGLLIPQ